MARFVLLYHDCPPSYERASHWDFMLESGEVLRTWALDRLPHDWQTAHSATVRVFPNCPSLALENRVAALQLGDHRRDYLDLEGPLTGGRGAARRVAAGAYRSDNEAPDEWLMVLTSGNFSANVQLSRSDADDETWTLFSTECKVLST